MNRNNKNNIIQVFEYGTLKWIEKSFFDEKHFNSLVKFNDRNENKYFTVIHKGIKFNQFVGVIRVDNLTIEILPKIHKVKETEDDKKLSHTFLLEMLKKCRNLKVNSISKANLKLKYYNLLEYYLWLYLRELELLLRKGLVKKYRFEEENLPTLKGKLLTQQQIIKNQIHRERFYVKYQKYDYNNLLNKILAEAFNILPSLTTNQSLLSYHKQLQLLVPSIEADRLNKKQLASIKYDRKTERYKDAVEIALMIILNYMPDINFGRNNVIAILFDMNRLFEEYIYMMIKSASNSDVIVQSQMSQEFWQRKRIRPDIFISSKDKKVIIDTKWKLVRDNNPSDDDLKQMFVYNEYFGSTESILLYPQFENNRARLGKYVDRTHNCRLEFVDLVRDGSVNRNIGKEILEML